MNSNENTIYGNNIDEMRAVMKMLSESIEEAAVRIKERTGMEPVEHLKYRIKSDESMREKCRRKGLPETEDSALHQVQDAIGLRIVCTFLDDVYSVRDSIKSIEGIEVVREKDYIRNVKPNGYRSYHLIVKIQGYFAEIQIRTISMDTWAALEHHMRYKKKLGGNTALIFEELKRCADELAATDASMLTIRNMINEEE